jgi:predicted secreted hydrolase
MNTRSPAIKRQENRPRELSSIAFAHPARDARVELRTALKSTALAIMLIAGSALAADRPGADGFLLALPGYEFSFPHDHGSHDGYRTEWWYYTGHLETESGRRFGFEVAFFRVGLVPPTTGGGNPWDLHNLALAHFALTDINASRFRYYEKMNRASPFTADARTGSLQIFNEGWSIDTVAADAYRLVASTGDDSVALTLRSRKPPAIHGENGISVKAEGAGYASHYYSLTRLEVTGVVSSNGRSARCRGLAWMDHEYGSSALRETQQGWDWFAVQLDNDTEMMLYQIRRHDGTPDVTSSGSVINSDGTVIHISSSEMRVESLGHWKSPHSAATYPMGWRVSVPSLNIALELHEELRDQELITRSSTRVTYWEGAAAVNGRFGGNAVRGSGYVEMTGYDRAFAMP